jgi:hypothetical protein
MTVSRKSDRTKTWFVFVGAVVGLAVGILVSVMSDVPFAPEAGLLLGAFIGWFSHALRHRPLPD